MTAEEWRDIPGRLGYQVSSCGRVRSVERTIWQLHNSGKLIQRRLRGRACAPWIDGIGRSHVTLVGKRYTVHSLVAAAFHGPRPEGLEIRHLDGNPQDNRPENLLYGTGSENAADMVAHGRHREAIKEVCPRQHPLEAPNLIPAQLAAGKRACLACNRAHSEVRRRTSRNQPSDFQAIADAYYAELVARPGPLPPGPRLRGGIRRRYR